MTMRAGWTFNGKHFRETYDINGRRVYFVDGKPITRAEFVIELSRAMAASNAPHSVSTECLLT
jgi:hypothetical protein